jgi:F-type H+-transporting ATPase subunit b
MDQTIQQIGGLLLGAIPTVILLLFLYTVYHFLVYRPLQRVLSERRERTEGAVEKARADIAAAEAKALEYEDRLREAKVAIFKAQESRRQHAQQARAAAVAQARGKADAKVKEAKTAILSDMESAKVHLQSEVERLANEIIRTILHSEGSGRAPAAGGQS